MKKHAVYTGLSALLALCAAALLIFQFTGHKFVYTRIIERSGPSVVLVTSAIGWFYPLIAGILLLLSAFFFWLGLKHSSKK